MCCDTDISGGSWQSSSINVPGGYSKSSSSCAFENGHGKMKAGNLNSSDRFAWARRNDHDSVRKSWSAVIQLPVMRLLLRIDEPIGSALRPEHVELYVGIPCKSECAPNDEGAP